MRNGAFKGCAHLTDTTAHGASAPGSNVSSGPFMARCRSAAFTRAPTASRVSRVRRRSQRRTGTGA